MADSTEGLQIIAPVMRPIKVLVVNHQVFDRATVQALLIFGPYSLADIKPVV